MNPASVTTLAFALVAGWAAALNFFTYSQRREDRGHFWLGVAGAGVLLMGVATAQLYESQKADHAVAVYLVLTAASLPFFLGFLRFSEIFLGRSIRTAERVLIPAIAASCVLTAMPGGAFQREPIPRLVTGFDIVYVDAVSTPIGAAIATGFLALALYLVSLYARALPEDPSERAPIVIAIWLFVATAANDVGVGLGLLHTPLLFVVGYGGIVIAFTAVLTKRFVASVAQVEESANLLQEAAFERSEALRQKDLQLGHGEALATIGTLAAGLAHEINNPIAFVTANLNHLDELRSEPESESEFVEVLDETREGVERIRSIVAELLRLARRQEGGVEEVDLSSVVESVLPLLRHEARGRASLQIHLESVPPVMGDRRLLGQVVVNLVLNAIHAIPEADPDADRPGEIIVATTTDRPLVRLHVRDTGTGIPPEVVDQIFEPFYTTKAANEGTGLGLAITHQLVTRHGGRIHVDTSPSGTTMTVDLPVAGTPALTESEPREGR